MWRIYKDVETGKEQIKIRNALADTESKKCLLVNNHFFKFNFDFW